MRRKVRGGSSHSPPPSLWRCRRFCYGAVGAGHGWAVIGTRRLHSLPRPTSCFPWGGGCFTLSVCTSFSVWCGLLTRLRLCQTRTPCPSHKPTAPGDLSCTLWAWPPPFAHPPGAHPAPCPRSAPPQEGLGKLLVVVERILKSLSEKEVRESGVLRTSMFDTCCVRHS